MSLPHHLLNEKGTFIIYFEHTTVEILGKDTRA